MSDENWITPEKPVYVLCGPAKDTSLVRRGLLWGRGDPHHAYLGWDNHWAVVKAASYREWPEYECVEFKDYELVFEGERMESVNRLVALGADPAGITLDIQVREDASIARTGYYGTSIVAGDGFAGAGFRGYAKAGAGGIARVDEAGTAVAGDGGLAIVQGKRYGTAIAGDHGVAIGQGRFKHLSVGNRGIAITTGGWSRVGDEGVGIGSIYDEVSGGRESIVIGTFVSGGPGSVLIAKSFIDLSEAENGDLQIACGIVGRDGVEPWVQYTVKNHVLVPVKEESDE